ncbi:hypothetical protein [Microvirga sp. VF16]|uniref:hypothetical protein n=1 Tax=Microvirga sp. VF16 TaxID=2807101 RepID=UPI00193C91F2|nr:hypothetical protein [Microvirga sp. VF16]QRM35988.1 hypothetical protein JO965_47325 [Microvirga sp. VF16]
MSKAPRRPSQRNDLRQQDGGAGAQRPNSTTRKSRAASKKANTVLDSLSAEIPNEVREGPEGNTVSSLPLEQGDALARDGSLVAEGNQNGPDQQSPHSRIGGEVEQPVQTIPLADGLALAEPNQDVASGQPQPSEAVAIRANQRQEPTQHHPVVRDLKSDSREDGKSSMQGRAAHRTQMGQQTNGRANPIYILAATTLGIPAVLLIPLIGTNPGIQEGTFTTVLGFLLLSAFVTAVVFEIKRLVDQPSEEHHH